MPSAAVLLIGWLQTGNLCMALSAHGKSTHKQPPRAQARLRRLFRRIQLYTVSTAEGLAVREFCTAASYPQVELRAHTLAETGVNMRLLHSFDD